MSCHLLGRYIDFLQVLDQNLYKEMDLLIIHLVLLHVINYNYNYCYLYLVLLHVYVIIEMFDKFTEEEHIEEKVFTCEKCSIQKQSIKKQFLFEAPPEVLRLHLKRFRFM